MLLDLTQSFVAGALTTFCHPRPYHTITQSNDTLANNNCPAFTPLHKHYEWAERFTAPIISRLQRDLGMQHDLLRHPNASKVVKEGNASNAFFGMRPGSALSPRDVIVLFGMCAFDSVYHERTSRFCMLFSKEEFLEFEYFQVGRHWSDERRLQGGRMHGALTLPFTALKSQSPDAEIHRISKSTTTEAGGIRSDGPREQATSTSCSLDCWTGQSRMRRRPTLPSIRILRHSRYDRVSMQISPTTTRESVLCLAGSSLARRGDMLCFTSCLVVFLC